MGHRLEKGLQAASHPESGQFLKYFVWMFVLCTRLYGPVAYKQ